MTEEKRIYKKPEDIFYINDVNEPFFQMAIGGLFEGFKLSEWDFTNTHQDFAFSPHPDKTYVNVRAKLSKNLSEKGDDTCNIEVHYVRWYGKPQWNFVAYIETSKEGRYNPTLKYFFKDQLKDYYKHILEVDEDINNLNFEVYKQVRDYVYNHLLKNTEEILRWAKWKCNIFSKFHNIIFFNLSIIFFIMYFLAVFIASAYTFENILILLLTLILILIFNKTLEEC